MPYIFMQSKLLGNFSSKEIILDDEEILFVGLQVVDDLPIDLRVSKLRAGERYYYLYGDILLPVLLEEIDKEQV